MSGLAAPSTSTLPEMLRPSTLHSSINICTEDMSLNIFSRPLRSLNINENWEFRQLNSREPFRPVSAFPTTVHLDLLHHKLIPDPNILTNENDVQWVGEEDWEYTTTISASSLSQDSHLGHNTRCMLVFEGLDTFATVRLDGDVVLENENMFVKHRVEITDLLRAKPGANLKLSIVFKSAFLKGKQLMETLPQHKWGCWNGDPSRLAVRKAQYSYGWDWGMTMLTAGPWKPIRLEMYEARIADLWMNTTVGEDLKSAEVTAKVDTEGAYGYRNMHVKFELSLDGHICCRERVLVVENHAEASFFVNNSNLALWYPLRYGKQPLYTMSTTLVCDNQTRDTKSKKFGVRRARLIQQPLHHTRGCTFYFEINNIPIFCGGSNWIPGDNFLPRLTPEKYSQWLHMVAESNQAMIRVWAGGIYEHDSFYDTCDELGVLVWQDFMFACGNYPTNKEFLNSVEVEATQNVERLRHHPSIVIWAGNNEDYQYAESEGLTYNFEDQDPESWLKTDFPARYIYEKLLADVCKRLIPDVPYHYGSPWSGGMKTSGPDGSKIGDHHQWNIWHGRQAPYQEAFELSARFISEFGMQALPSMNTIEDFLERETQERFSQSRALDAHNKATGHEGRLALYLETNIRYKKEPLEMYIYATQLMQSECLTSCFRAWKRNWKGEGKRECGGVLVWQLNDVWPCTSWSIVDSNLIPKAGYYAVKRALGNITVAIERLIVIKPRDRYTRVNIQKEIRLQLWACNLTESDVVTTATLKTWNIGTGRAVSQKVQQFSDITLPANQSTDFANNIPFPMDTNPDFAAQMVLRLELFDHKTRHRLACHTSWPDPLKYVRFTAAKIKLEERSDGHIIISTDIPVKGLMLFAMKEDSWLNDTAVTWLDNCVDLVPHEHERILVRGMTAAHRVGCRYLGMRAQDEERGQELL